MKRRNGDFSDSLSEADLTLLSDRIIRLEEQVKSLKQRHSASDEVVKNQQQQLETLHKSLQSTQSGTLVLVAGQRQSNMLQSSHIL